MLSKIRELKKKMFFIRFSIMFEKAMQEGKITKFDDEIFEKMSNTIISCLPVSFYIKYSNQLFDQGTCFDRSLYMFLALDNALLIRGDNKDLEYNYGKGHERHGWVEVGDYVYDPSLMLRFNKETYYSIYGARNLSKVDFKTYVEQNKNFVEASVSHDYNEFKPHGKRRLELGMLMIQIKILSDILGDEQFTKDLNDYLALVEYDSKQIKEEQRYSLNRMLKNKEFMAVISGNVKK